MMRISIRNQMVLKDLAVWKLKSGGREEDQVFPNEAGQPLSSMVRRYFLKALREAKIPRVSSMT